MGRPKPMKWQKPFSKKAAAVVTERPTKPVSTKKRAVFGVAGLGTSTVKVKQGKGVLVTKKNAKKVAASSKVKRVHQAPLVVAGEASLETMLNNVSAPGPQKVGPFRSGDRILLIGEGNFSFAASLANVFGGRRLVATSLDSKQVVLEKYGEAAQDAFLGLRLSGARVIYGIDATKPDDLEVCLGDFTGFDVIAFNFPHLGGSTPEAVKANQDMLSGFFRSAYSVLEEKGKIMVTLRDTEFYRSWGLEELGTKDKNLRLAGKVPFDKTLFDGYQEARTNPATRETPSADEAFTYIFQRK